MEKYFGKINDIPFVQYGNCTKVYAQQECLMDNNLDVKRHLRNKPDNNVTKREFKFIYKLRRNDDRFLVVRYNCMGLFCELLTSSTELDFDIQPDNKIFKSAPSSVHKVIKLYNKYRNNPKMKVSEFNKAVKMLIESYHDGKQLKYIDNAHIFDGIKQLKNDKIYDFYFELNLQK